MTDPYVTAGDIRRHLAAITDHYDVALHPPKRGTSGGGTASKEPPPPVSVDVLDARNDTHRDLVHYAQVVLLECVSAEGRTIATRVDAGNVHALARFLDTWAEQFARGNPLEAEACARDLAGHAAKLRGMALPDRRDWMNLGTCPLEVDFATCGGQVRAYPGKDPQCQRCGTEAPAAWWERVMFPDIETSELVTADELVLLLHRAFGGTPIKPSTIRQWVRRELIVAVGHDPEGRSLYDRTAVIRAVSARQEARA